MSYQHAIALVILCFWTALLCLFCVSALLDRHRRGKQTPSWVKRLHEYLYTRTDK